MELPETIRIAVEEIASEYDTKELIGAARAVSERYRGAHNGKPLVTKNIEAAAYAAARMPATYGAISTALRLSALPGTPHSVLDVGAGTGAGTIAAAEYCELDAACCMEPESAMRELGKRLLSASEHPALQSAEYVSGNVSEGLTGRHADLVIAAYVLNEISGAERTAAIESLWSAADQTLLLVEPGTPEGFEILREARCRLQKLGAYTAAPCTHENDCPIAAEDWCHFTCRVARSRLHRLMKSGDAPYEDEKFTFLAMTHEAPMRAVSRVLRHPRITSGRIDLVLCTENGIREQTITKKDGALFKKARKADCGDDLGLPAGEG